MPPVLVRGWFVCFSLVLLWLYFLPPAPTGEP